MKPVLVVEADGTYASALRHLLQGSGFTVSIAQDESNAVHILQESTFTFLVFLLGYTSSLPLVCALLTHVLNNATLRRHRYFLLSGGIETLLPPLQHLILACHVTLFDRPSSWNTILPLLEQAACEET